MTTKHLLTGLTRIIAFAGIAIAFSGCNRSTREETQTRDLQQPDSSATAKSIQHQDTAVKDGKAHYEFDAQGKEYVVNPDGTSALTSDTHLEFDKDGNQFAIASDGTVFKLGKK